VGEVTLLGTSDQQIRYAAFIPLYFVGPLSPQGPGIVTLGFFLSSYLNNIQFHTSKSGLDRGTVYTY
jgi:hypothetical protein